MMTSLMEQSEYFSSASPREKKEFVTVVSVDPVEPAKSEQPFVTILSIGDDDDVGETATAPAQRSADCGEEVLVYRLPGERLGFGLKFDGGSNAVDCVTKLLIQSCAADSPASRTVVSWGHFAPGDEILQIDGVPVSRMTRMECVRSLKESNVQLKLRVRQGNGLRSGAPSNSASKNPAPPPVPPRKYPRRNSKHGDSSATSAIAASGTAPLVTPPDGFADSKMADVSATPQMARLREKLCIPEAKMYTDLLAQEASSCSLLACHESESDDTGSSMSTVVDGGWNGKYFSASTTSNSSFSDVRSIASLIDVETGAMASPPASDDEALRRTRKFDLDRVLEPFLQLEREFSSCATTIEHHDLFQKLVAAAALNNEVSADENESSATAETTATTVMLEPPDVFQDDNSYQQQRLGIKDDLNNNTIQNGDEYPPICCDANEISTHHTISVNNHSNVSDDSDEVPPKPLPRREIPCKTLTKYGKRRPPPPPPPQHSTKPNRCPTPSEVCAADLQHESSDSDISVDRLPRLIDFVPKDRVDVVVPSAVHPDPMDMLLERQRIMSIVNQNVGSTESVTSAKNEFSENHLTNHESFVELRSSSMIVVPSIEDPDDSGRIFKPINACSEVKIRENGIESEPNEMSAHANCIDSADDATMIQRTDNGSLTMVSQIESDKLLSCEPLTTSETVKSLSLPTNYATLPCKEAMKFGLCTYFEIGKPSFSTLETPCFTRLLKGPAGFIFDSTVKETQKTGECHIHTTPPGPLCNRLKHGFISGNVPVEKTENTSSQISSKQLVRVMNEDIIGLLSGSGHQEEEPAKMKPLLAVPSSVNLSTPTSPPSYSRMPPDGHEFPQNYQEIGPNGDLFELNLGDNIAASPATLKSAAYHEPPTFVRKSAITAYTSDVLNEAKFLDIDRKQPLQPPVPQLTEPAATSVKMPAGQLLGDAPKRHSQSWRNDERSERSVKDKIAMFSDAISKAAPSSTGTCHSPKLRDIDVASKTFSKSMCAVNTIVNGGAICAVVAPRFKSKDCGRDDVDSLSTATNHGVNMNRAQSSIDLTLFSSSCSSAYSSCSPDSSLSPMSSPSYTIGSSSTLPRKNKSPPVSDSSDSSSSCRGAVSNADKKHHPTLGRTVSFCGSTPSPLHTRSQSLVDVLHISGDHHSPLNCKRDSLTTLIEQRRRTMSKLRGLVIPEKTNNQVPLKPIIDLPEIKSKEVVVADIVDRNVYQQTRHQNLSSVPNSNYYSKKTDVVIDCAWKSVLNPTDIPKYSPAFKRKTLTVYGVSSSASSLSSSLNSSREELRDSSVATVVVATKKSPPPAKPPRSCHNQLVYGPTIYKSIFANKQPAPVNREKAEYQISCNEGSKLQEDSDNDSAVSSSRSSLCQEYSPPSSPSPGAGIGGADVSTYENDRISNDSPSQSSSRTLRRTLSSETSVSLVSTTSTLTSGSQASCSSNGGDGFHEPSKRVLKAESVEAINRKNVLSSAKYSCGKDFKVGSPLIKDVFDGHRFSDAFNSVRKEREWFEYEKYNDGSSCQTEIKVAYLEEIQDEAESDSSVKGSSSVDTDEALDKSLDSTDSLCGNYKSDYLLLDHHQSVDRAKKEVGSDSDFAEPLSEESLILEKSILSELLKSEDLRKSKQAAERIVGKRCSVLDAEPKKSVSDIKKTFERTSSDAAVTTVFRKMRPSMHSQPNHLRMSSTDSTTSEDSLPASSVHSLNTNLLKEQQFGSITSLASSSSLISQQELQQLIDDASQTLEESSASGDHDLMVIILHRDTVTSSIGITLAGGADYEAKEITVHKVLLGSPADKDGRIQKGDRILSINGRNMKGVTHREALSILKAPRPEVVLVVSRWKADGPSSNTAVIEDPLVATFKNTVRPPRIPEVLQDCDNENLTNVSNNKLADKSKKGPVMSVTLMKEGGGLGFSLEGGKDSPSGDLPLTIKKIFTGGCAAKSGLLMAGDELVSLNNVDVTTMSRTEAWSLMKRLEPGQVVLNIRRSLKE